ncbi:hypothetical protein [Pasteuria penetrans]|uniref:hypothetical protein n=1 Tax=Pasteuria penetrans TaxID=86005 RepID=UPI000FC0131E|nr:hypothetical protein [Pasteuria penetrans]
MKTHPMKKLAIVSVVSLFSTTPLISTANLVQASPGGGQLTLSENSMHDMLPPEWIDPESGLGTIEITEQELSRDVSEPIIKHMKQPPNEQLSEKLNEKGMKADIQSARLFKLVPTTDTPEEIRNGLKDSPLSAYFIGYAIVDKESEQKVGALVSAIDGLLSPPNFKGGVDKCSSRAKRGLDWGDVGDCAIVGLLGTAGRSGAAYLDKRTWKKLAYKAALRAAGRALVPGGAWIFVLQGGACLYLKA